MLCLPACHPTSGCSWCLPFTSLDKTPGVLQVVATILFREHWTMAVATYQKDSLVVRYWDPEGTDTEEGLERVSQAAAKAFLASWWGEKKAKNGPPLDTITMDRLAQPAGDESSCGICVAAAVLALVAGVHLNGPISACIPQMRAFLGASIVDRSLPLHLPRTT